MSGAELRMYSRHLRACGFCMIPGARDWFKLHGLDWKKFLREGLPLSAFDNIKDSLLAQAVSQTKRDEAVK